MTDQSYKLSGLLEQFLAARGLQDCEIICQDGRVECHSTMLVVASPMWRQILATAALEETNNISLLLPDFTCSTVNTVLEILYRGGTTQSDPAVLQDTFSLIHVMLPELNRNRNTLELQFRNDEEFMSSSESQDWEGEVTDLKRDGYTKFDETERITCWEKSERGSELRNDQINVPSQHNHQNETQTKKKQNIGTGFAHTNNLIEIRT